MKEHPILFSGPMVLALLAGRKSVTRRLSKQWLKVKAGDRLWVREAWAVHDGYLIYRADLEDWSHIEPLRWSPSIHMHRTSSRILLECEEDARPERLQDITEEESRLEGIDVLPLQSADDPSAWWQSAPGVHQDRTARGSFIQLWSTLHTKPGERWEDNPEVVRVGKFRRIA